VAILRKPAVILVRRLNDGTTAPPQFFCASTLVMNKAVIATIRDRRGKIAEFVARQGPDDILVDLVLSSRGENYQDDLAPLLLGTIDLLNNGILYLRSASDEPLVEIEQVLRENADQSLKLVYNAAGIEQAYEMIRQIALKQPATEPFSRVVDALNRRLAELGLPHVGK
jgi:hypothetical protein